jgi:hypothetical protein
MQRRFVMDSPIMLEMVEKEYARDARRSEEHRKLVLAANGAKTRSRASTLWVTIAGGVRRPASAINNTAQTIRSWFTSPTGPQEQCC